jgi:hypothetical protein
LGVRSNVTGVTLVESIEAVTAAPTQSGIELDVTCAHGAGNAAPVNVTVPVGKLLSSRTVD